MFDYIKTYYEMGLYTKENLETFQTSGMITVGEYGELVK
ncbi:XkdX family protein [Dellaglioa sp. L3N]